MKKIILFNYSIMLSLFCVFSIVSIYCASIYTSSELGSLALKQFIWYFAGIFILIGIMKLGINYVYHISSGLYVVLVLLLGLLLIFGEPINNSKCWFIIPGIGSFQPSEFMKIILVLVLANEIYKYRCDSDNSLKNELKFLLRCLFIVIIPSVLTFLQPDTGAVLIYLIIFLTMMFFAGIRWRWFLFALLFLFVIVGICGGLYFYDEELFVSIFGTSLYYRIERIFMWSDGVGLQLENALAAIGSSSWFGHGFNNTPIYFPESSTDFIFAVYASNFGFVGVLFILSLFLYFDLFILKLIKKSSKSVGTYVLTGFLGMLMFQQIQNIGMTIGLFPIMGITLPFISYGGSSLVSYIIIYALIICISLEKKKTLYK